MSLVLRFKTRVQQLTGIRFYRKHTPWGLDVVNDLRRLDRDFQPKVIFDVGANIGQRADYFSSAFPGAQIHCFEPVAATFAALKERQEKRPDVHCHRVALSDRRGTGKMAVSDLSVISSLEQTAAGGAAAEDVELRTLANFAADHGIARIDLLKIDTEGHDLAVLEGAKPILEPECIRFILTEVTCSTHKPRAYPGAPMPLVSDTISFLERHGYRCLGLYGQHYSVAWRVHFGNALFAPIPEFP